VIQMVDGPFPTVRAARGVVLGLLLGDAVGAAAGRLPPSGPILAGAGGQLACWTVEGLIRAHVRGAHRGITSPAGLVFAAYGRWARLRGELPGSGPLADGWLAAVPALAQRRGAAPATLAAVRAGRIGTVAAPVSRSVGPHAVTRTLPAGLCSWWNGPAYLAAELAATTHAPAAVTAAAKGAELVAALVLGEPIDAAVAAAEVAAVRLGLPPSDVDLGRAIALARTGVAEIDIVRGLALDATSTSALTGGVYVAAATGPAGIRDALLLAASAGDGGHAAAVAGALLGAVHGPDRLPLDWLARLELVWPGDTIARDLVRQLTENPSGTEYEPPTDPDWWARYPGG
jgi:ADP-ribosylglycohydrolase